MHEIKQGLQVSDNKLLLVSQFGSMLIVEMKDGVILRADWD